MSYLRRCASCCTSISELPRYATLCKPCFIAAKKQEHVDLLDEVDELRAEVERLRAKHVGIPPAMLRRLLQLCHPDKHNGSELAGTVTAELLALRAKVTQ